MHRLFDAGCEMSVLTFVEKSSDLEKASVLTCLLHAPPLLMLDVRCPCSRCSRNQIKEAPGSHQAICDTWPFSADSSAHLYELKFDSKWKIKSNGSGGEKIKWGIFNQTPGFEVFILFSSFCWTKKSGIIHCCFTFTETIRTIRDREPRTSTSTFTQLLSSKACLFLKVALRPQRP